MLKPRTLRVRLALVFGMTTTVLASLFGLLASRQTRGALTRGVDEGLVPLAAELTDRLEREGPELLAQPLPSFSPPSDAFAQVLTRDGRLVAGSPGPAATRPLLTPARAAEAARHEVIRGATVEKRPQPGEPSPRHRLDPVRLLATPVSYAGAPYVAVVGTSFDETRAIERELELTLALGLPTLAALVALGGWLLTGAMFSPARALIEQADAISAGEPGNRLVIGGAGGEFTELAGRLNAMLDRISAAISRERAFLDEASHELRTPISIVRGELELARARVSADGDMRETLDSALDELDRLEHLAHNLLVLARSRSERLGETRSPVDLETVARRAARAVSRRATLRGIDVRVTGTGVVSGDEVGLERAVVNLLDNALRFARGRVSVAINGEEDAVHLEVGDDGPGFDPSVLPHAFDRFTTGPRGDAGLGLAIVAAIADAHGGRVEAENHPEGGAVVRLSLPPA